MANAPQFEERCGEFVNHFGSALELRLKVSTAGLLGKFPFRVSLELSFSHPVWRLDQFSRNVSFCGIMKDKKLRRELNTSCRFLPWFAKSLNRCKRPATG